MFLADTESYGSIDNCNAATEPLPSTSSDQDPEPQTMHKSLDNLPVDYSTYRAIVKRLSEMQDEIKSLKKEKEAAVKEARALKDKCRIYEEVLSISSKNRQDVLKEIRLILCDFFSEQQLDIMLKKKKSNNVRMWSEKDIANALTLKCLSAKAYRYIHKTWKIPLPNLSFSSNMLASTVYFDRQCIGNRR